MKPWPIALALLLTACPKGTSPPPVDNAGGGTPAPAEGCKSDDDCVVSCARADECCDQLCEPCEQVFLKADLEAHRAWQVNACEAPATSCPVARCMAPTEATSARCDAGACVLERRAL